MSRSIAPVLVLVPALNEAQTIGAVVESLLGHGFDALVIDDGSTDETTLVAEGAGALVLRLPLNLGVGGALRLGFREACRRGYRTAVQCDADGQHDPAQIGILLDGLSRGDLDMVIGSRFVEGEGAYEVARTRRMAMRLLASIASRATGVRITDPTSGFRAITGDLLAEFARTYPAEYLGDTVEALVEAGRGGFRVGEVPVTMAERQGGEASAGPVASAWYSIRVLITIAVRWRSHPASRPPKVVSAGS
jgi:glycosyltransferase involved in cell wall biosynthesis